MTRSVLRAALIALSATGCATDPAPSADSQPTAEADTVTVTADDDSCRLSRTDLTAGIETFAITNVGSTVTEVYVYQGTRIVTEKENIGPGTSYDLTVDLAAGSYEVACKPGMTGDGIRTPISVTGAAAAVDPAADAAVAAYRQYVQGQADQLPGLVQQLRDALAAGDVDAAKVLYVSSRMPWERIEPVAESFGDLDPRVDIREADLESGQEFTGWHRIEKALWTGEPLPPMVAVADQLHADVSELAQRVPHAAMTVVSIGNGAKELLDEVSTGKITGEEEAFSHTDLDDFQANLDGAREAFTALRPLVEKTDPQLAATLDSRFAQVQAALDVHRSGPSFVSYDTVTPEQRQQLSRAVDALGEPLAQLAAVGSP